MSTTFRPSDPSSRNDVPSRVELQLLRVQRTMFIVNCMWAVVFGFVLWWIATSHCESSVAAQASGVEAVGRMSLPMFKDGKRLEVSREPELAVLPVIESADSGKLFVIPPWSAPPPASKAAAPPKFKYRYVTEAQVNCKTCPGGVCPTK